jgi:hypothetical protein
MTKRILILALIVTVLMTTAVFAIEKRAYKIREDFGIEKLQDCFLQYYYYVPCPTYSWFYGFYGWLPGDIVGQFFTVGSNPTGGYAVCDSALCYNIIGLKILDFAGYGSAYPGLFTIEFDIYCSDESGCPVGPSLWNSGPFETVREWNDIPVSPAISVKSCATDPGPPPTYPRFLITATHTGTVGTYPEWGTDNIQTLLEEGCAMHVYGCLPALYPRPTNSHYTTIHSGYYGVDFQYCPPQWFMDGKDTTPDGTQYGYLELAWKVLLDCAENPTEPTTWSGIKSMYR